MLLTVEAVIDQEGRVRLLEPVYLAEERRALVTILPAEGVAPEREAWEAEADAVLHADLPEATDDAACRCPHAAGCPGRGCGKRA